MPSWIVRNKETRHCWREQFPLDLCRAMTCHRAQGQTMRNCSVAINLGLNNPDRQVPPDIRSILYVALTRATQLKDLLVEPISQKAWERIEQSENMCAVEARLVNKAKEFAAMKGMLRKVKCELAFEPDYSNCVQEFSDLEQGHVQPARKEPATVEVTEADLLAETHKGTFSMFANGVTRERQIGVDQGARNLAIVAVDTEVGQVPVVVAAQRYDLKIRERTTASEVCRNHTSVGLDATDGSAVTTQCR